MGASHRPLQEAAQAATESASQLAPLQTKQKVQKTREKDKISNVGNDIAEVPLFLLFFCWGSSNLLDRVLSSNK